MAKNATIDKSNGYDEIASAFIAQRNSSIGGSTVRHWSRTLPRGSSVLDLGWGHGVPISQVLIEEGLAVYAIDASPRMIAAFQQRFPLAHAECAALEGSTFFDRSFDGVVAWGLLFLMPPGIQATVIGKVAKALNPFGKFLFTAPQEAVTWEDSLTGANPSR
jgi:SAM-dependent methyltransferase